MEMIGDFMIKAGGGMSGSSEGGASGAQSSMSSAMMGSMMGMQMWQELLPGLDTGDPINDMLEEQYDVIYGAWPNDKNEIVLVVNEKNELDDLTLYALGLLSRAEIDAIIDAAASGKEVATDSKKWTYEEICAMTFRAVMPYDRYTESNGLYVDISGNENMMKMLYESAMELRVVGIVRPNPDAEVNMLSGAIGYTHLLTEHIVEGAKNAPVVKAQLANPTVDVLTGLPFKSSMGMLSDAEKEVVLRAYLADLNTEEKASAYLKIQALKAQADPVRGLDVQVNMVLSQMQDKDMVISQISEAIAEQMDIDPAVVAAQLSELTIEELREMLRPLVEEQIKDAIAKQVEAGYAAFSAEQLAAMLDAESPSYTTEECALYYDEVTEFSGASYEENLRLIGSVDLDSPATINLYASSFENKDIIVETIARYNEAVKEEIRVDDEG